MLLRLRPDTVRRVLLRKTQTSTPLTKGSPTVDIPQENYHPCYSGLQVQGTANTPAAQLNILTCSGQKVNGNVVKKAIPIYNT